MLRHPDIRFEVYVLKRAITILVVILLVLITAGLTFIGTVHWIQAKNQAEIQTDPVTYKLESIAGLMDEYFIESYDADVLMTAAADGAAAAMVEATGDRWSYYISAEQMADYEEQLHNSYVGIGVTIQQCEEGERIVSVTAGSPAEEAGIQVGDICIEVEGQKTTELGMDGTKNMVRGEAGTFVKMRFLRGEETYDVSVERRAVLTPVSEWEMLDDELAWITIYNFDYHCAEQTLRCIDEALSQGAEGLLFDVRFNGGGLKDEMVEILDVLLPEGEIFRSVDYSGREEVDMSDADCLQIPMVVLVNEDSYSAAEFFAAALQEYELAKIVGVQTSGKGNFQYTLDVGDGSAVALSCGRYYTPKGVSLTDVGVTPDVEVTLEFDAYESLYYGILDAEEDAQLQAGISVLQDMIG